MKLRRSRLAKEEDGERKRERGECTRTKTRANCVGFSYVMDLVFGSQGRKGTRCRRGRWTVSGCRSQETGKRETGNWEQDAGQRGLVEERSSGEEDNKEKCEHSRHGRVETRRKVLPTLCSFSLSFFLSLSLSVTPYPRHWRAELSVHCPSDDKEQWRAIETLMLARPFEMKFRLPRTRLDLVTVSVDASCFVDAKKKSKQTGTRQQKKRISKSGPSFPCCLSSLPLLSHSPFSE
ncbi:hypothetical protein BKA57DRAFT_20739 [Linnemannia elongata]|nr:hypothetical protein BKA57DRAFT_20739 [Linnemannia elongata]